MGTTTIRVDSKTHKNLVELSEMTGCSIIDTVREAAEALRRQRFAHQVNDEMAALRSDAQAWAAYLADGDQTSVGDGVG